MGTMQDLPERKAPANEGSGKMFVERRWKRVSRPPRGAQPSRIVEWPHTIPIKAVSLSCDHFGPA